MKAPELWDGHAAERIVKILLEKLRPGLLNKPVPESSRIDSKS
jgi:hypothetical protein